MKNTKKGFTLVELLVVIAILAILSTVAVVGYTSFIKKADDSKASTELAQVKAYIEAEFMDDNKWTFTVGEGEDAVTYTVTKGQDGTITASAGFDTVIKACADLAVPGSFAVTTDGLVYTTKDGKGTATWKGAFVEPTPAP